jgi:hypothetical protein
MFDIFHNISANLEIFLNTISGNFWLGRAIQARWDHNDSTG